MDEIIEEAIWAREVMESFRNRIELMLADRPGSAGTDQLVAATTELKNDIKTANSSCRINGRKVPSTGPARFLGWALQRASADFRMRVDTDPLKAEWWRTLDGSKAYFEDYIARIRKECPEAG